MASKNSNKGISNLASVLQRRMARVNNNTTSVHAETGEIVQGNKLKLHSIPNAILKRSDYLVCSTIRKESSLKTGDRVLIIWTFDGEAVVIDKIS